MPTNDWSALAAQLTAALHLTTAPVAISFRDTISEGAAAAPSFDAPMPEPTPDGRTGRVPAGCVFWGHGAERTFSTVKEDHGNCSVGSYTHGFIGLEEAATHSDVAALLESGWVTMDDVPNIPAVAGPTGSVVYGPLAETALDPDVVLLRLNAKQTMVLSDALPGLRIEGKPQCHIVAAAKEQGVAVASVGCMLSRVRTGMPSEVMTAALPAGQLPAIVASIERTASIDAVVAGYAAEDALRFA